MKTEEYKNKIMTLNSSTFDEILKLLHEAARDPEVSLIGIDELNDVADDIFYGRLNALNKKNGIR